MTTKWKKPKFGLDEADDSFEEAGAYIYCPFTKEMCRKSPCMMWDSVFKRCLIRAAAEKLAAVPAIKSRAEFWRSVLAVGKERRGEYEDTDEYDVDRDEAEESA